MRPLERCAAFLTTSLLSLLAAAPAWCEPVALSSLGPGAAITLPPQWVDGADATLVITCSAPGCAITAAPLPTLTTTAPSASCTGAVSGTTITFTQCAAVTAALRNGAQTAQLTLGGAPRAIVVNYVRPTTPVVTTPAATTPVAVTPAVTATPSCVANTETLRERCARIAEGTPNGTDVLCVDGRAAGSGEWVLRTRGSEVDRLLLRPNRYLRVVAIRETGSHAAITATGAIGLTTPRVSGEAPPPRGVAGVADPTPTPAPCDDEDERTFAPRTENFTMTVTVGSRAAITFEILVDQLFAGAVRIGVASVLLGAVDRSYTARAVGGSGQAEVVATSNALVNFELVTGFALHFWDLIGPQGGRSYFRPRAWWSYLAPSPYVGFSVLAQRAGGIDALTALYLGGEWELARGFSIAAAVVVRRVTRLHEGFVVGSAALNEQDVTRESVGVGPGIVLSFSPDIFRVIAAQPSTF